MKEYRPQSLFEDQRPEPQGSGPVICLGMTFDNDEARCAHFTEELRKKLQDPEFRKIEGFPIGSDEDILNLSDPPYYTACPNPWIANFIAEWESQKPEQPEGNHYHREPFAADVSEGKMDPIYSAHSYHTKVPHKAIMRYILHYTQPGDIVFDVFCGTGMTGVAALMCGDRNEVLALGYQVKADGTILREEINEEGKNLWQPFSKIGIRKAVLSDLAPIGTFIAHNYTHRDDVFSFRKRIDSAFQNIRKKLGWMYETVNEQSGIKEELLFCVWSDVFICPECGEEIIFWDAALNDEGKVESEFQCQGCKSVVSKNSSDHALKTILDHVTKQPRKITKQVPVEVHCKNLQTGNKYVRPVNKHDLDVLKKIQDMEIAWHPSNKMMFKDECWGDQWRKGYHSDVTHDYHFFMKRPLAVLAEVRKELQDYLPGLFLITGTIQGLSRMQRYTPGSTFPNMIRSGTLYIGSLHREWNAISWMEGKVRGIIRMYEKMPTSISECAIGAQSASDLATYPENGIDYIFLDPPFGDNLAYSELNFLWEGWLKVFTNQQSEAIVSKHQAKELDSYRALMAGCFSQAYKALKPGHWMTVEFSNTKAAVWNSIQTALTEAGFIVANVSGLDKKQGSFNAITNTTSVKQDLVISAYKPNGGFEERFQKEAQTEEGVWDFVRTHLKYLPVTKQQGTLLQFVPERDPRILFDQMVAYYVRKGYPVPISSQEFQIGLSQRFIERDGMFFLPDQVAEYDRKKMTSGELKQMTMFVSDETSAIQWLRQLIKEKPQTSADITPQFMKQLQGFSKHEKLLDQRELLNQNFLCYDGKGKIPGQIVSWMRRSSQWRPIIEKEFQEQGVELLENLDLETKNQAILRHAADRWYVPDPNKAGDLEKLREKALLKEFEEYKEVKKKLKVFRLEAVRAGFKKAWQERDYAVIVAVADKIPNNVLEEDPKLLMWYDQAVTRMGGE